MLLLSTFMDHHFFLYQLPFQKTSKQSSLCRLNRFHNIGILKPAIDNVTNNHLKGLESAYRI